MGTSLSPIDGTLLEQLRADVYRVCLRILENAEDAEDAAQETLLRAYAHRHTFRGDSSAKTWVLRVASNLCLNLRAGKKTPLPLDEALPCSAARRSMEAAEEGTAYRQMVVETQKRGEGDRRSWDQLDCRIWQYITLAAWQGAVPPWRMVALALGEPESTIKYRVNRHIGPAFRAVFPGGSPAENGPPR